MATELQHPVKDILRELCRIGSPEELKTAVTFLQGFIQKQEAMNKKVKK